MVFVEGSVLKEVEKRELDAERVANLIDVEIPKALALFKRTAGEENLSPSLTGHLLEPLLRLRDVFEK